jgi:exosortase/archaeosortase family protein
MLDSRLVRWTLGAALAATGVWIFANGSWYRSLEAVSSERIVTGLLRERSWHSSGSSIFFIGLGGRHPAGLDVTQACSTATIAAAALIVTGLLIALARSTVGASLLALVAAVGLVAVVNVGRLVLLAWSAANWGFQGWFEWAHVYGGSLVSMVAVAGACALYLRLLRRSPANRRHRI